MELADLVLWMDNAIETREKSWVAPIVTNEIGYYTLDSHQALAATMPKGTKPFELVIAEALIQWGNDIADWKKEINSIPRVNYRLLEEAAREFILKVETGMARSKDSYSKFKKALNEIPKSEQLRQEAGEEENDLKAMGILNKAMREKRLEKWEDWKEKVITSPMVEYYEENTAAGRIIFQIRLNPEASQAQMIDFYPKANKLLIRNQNKWEQPGLKWLIDNLIKQ